MNEESFDIQMSGVLVLPLCTLSTSCPLCQVHHAEDVLAFLNKVKPGSSLGVDQHNHGVLGTATTTTLTTPCVNLERFRPLPASCRSLEHEMLMRCSLSGRDLPFLM